MRFDIAALEFESFKEFLLDNSNKIAQEITQKYSMLNEDNKTLVLTLINSLIEIQNKDTP